MNKNIKEAMLFILPLVLFILLFIFIPVIGTFFISLFRDVTFQARKFVFIDNYIRIFQDAQFWGSTLFTVLFTLVSVFIEMVVGMVFALVINEKIPMRGMIRGIALLPWAIPSIISARVWQLIYRYDYGVANYFMQNLFGVSVNWLGSKIGAFFSLVLADAWRTIPFVAIILLAGLQTVPETLYKQAKVDGANIFQRFFKITLPSIKPIILVALLFRTIDALRVFDIIYVITGGGPGGATNSLSLYSYKYFLLGDFGYGSATSIMLFIIAFLIAFIYVKSSKIREAIHER